MLRRVSGQSAPFAAAAAGHAIRGNAVDAYADQRNKLKGEVRNIIANNTIFSKAMFEKCFDRFFGLDLEWSYVTAFSPEIVAKHIVGFSTATAEADLGKPFEYAFEKLDSDDCFWYCDLALASQLRTQRRIEAFLLRRNLSDNKRGVSIRSYLSPGGNTALFTMHIEDFPNPSTKADKFESVEAVSTKHFLEVRQKASLERYSDILSRLTTSITPVYSIRATKEDNTLNVTMGFLPDGESWLSELSTLFSNLPGAKVTRSFVETFSGGQHVYSFFVKGASHQAIETVANQIGMLPTRPTHEVTKLFDAGVISPLEVNYSHSLIIFAFYFTPPPASHDFQNLTTALAKDEAATSSLKKLRAQMHSELLSEEYIAKLLATNISFIKELYQNFQAGPPNAKDIAALYAKINTLTENDVERSVLSTFVRFNESVAKTNFFKVKRAAACYRLDPKIFMKGLDFPAIPFGVFLVVGATFRGFHVRFSDIARGGIRMVLNSKGPKYVKNRRTLFQENYNLAYTQMLKNKDIPESGSKGVMLVSPRRGPNPKVMYLQYLDSILDVLVPGEEGIRDSLANKEILFMGPDENTAGTYPSDAAFHARDRGYKQWKSFTTGKGEDIGGIPHEVFGMTTESVRANVMGIYREKGITDQSKLTKFQTGGPDGDLGSNEILLGGEKTLAIVDKSGVLYDPNGLNKEELIRLAKARPDLTVKDFDVSKLSAKGFFVSSTETNRTLPDGTFVASGEKLRDEFHFTDYVIADTFVPCGGRPAAVTLDNVHRMLVGCPEGYTGDTMLYGKLGDLAAQGKTRFKYIVEGANLFITQEARLALENVGVIVVKDAAANKGGVTSSSFEVLAALSLSDEEHAANMCVKNHTVPKFYDEMTKEIVQRIRDNATREYNATSKEVAKGVLGGKRTLISDELSKRIVQMRTTIIASDLFNDLPLRKLVLKKYVPQTIQKLVPIEKVIERVPENYLRACFSVYIASDYVYSTGIGATEFDFFEYMHKLHAASA